MDMIIYNEDGTRTYRGFYADYLFVPDGEDYAIQAYPHGSQDVEILGRVRKYENGMISHAITKAAEYDRERLELRLKKIRRTRTLRRDEELQAVLQESPLPIPDNRADFYEWSKKFGAAYFAKALA